MCTYIMVRKHKNLPSNSVEFVNEVVQEYKFGGYEFHSLVAVSGRSSSIPQAK